MSAEQSRANNITDKIAILSVILPYTLTREADSSAAYIPVVKPPINVDPPTEPPASIKRYSTTCPSDLSDEKYLPRIFV